MNYEVIIYELLDEIFSIPVLEYKFASWSDTISPFTYQSKLQEVDIWTNEGLESVCGNIPGRVRLLSSLSSLAHELVLLLEFCSET